MIYQRVSITPGKHGLGDLRIALSGVAPTHGETIMMLGAKLIAEDRYSGPNQLGRYLLWYYIDLLQAAKKLEAVQGIADACQAETDAPMSMKERSTTLIRAERLG